MQALNQSGCNGLPSARIFAKPDDDWARCVCGKSRSAMMWGRHKLATRRTRDPSDASLRAARALA
eukprot:CAMPEP_0113563538 /NCGR_PEP_ID=MMETSP0015_2-20120614/21125_1 /TAXON_ID=2838 /ORGANISM="Odontella" /LENGTH=64 /DNA_ID=CAMNT_0000465531 /DNA_START=261 /DNA_END=452 /DNA_ORIENTATION=- /assembly_acc=CAM_ASM_000160